MKILWLTPLFPYPLYSGGQVRVYNLIKNLAKNHQITLFSFIRPEREQGPIERLQPFCLKIKTFKGRRIWTARNLFLASFSHLPFTITHFYGDQKVKQVLREELSQEKYDLVHFESFYTSPYLHCVSSLPKVMGNENIECLLYQRYVDQKMIPLKWLLSFDVWKMKRYEQNAWRKADLNLAVSETDAKKIKKVTNKKCVVVSNGVDLDYFTRSKQSLPAFGGSTVGGHLIKPRKPIILFVGDFKYFANQDALRFLAKEIWPLIKRKTPDAILRLVGKNLNPYVKSLASKEIIVDDQVEDIRQAYNSADVFIVPMKIGSGTNIKVLEAMASGLPVVSTSVGAEGIEMEKGKEIIIGDESEELANSVVELLVDRDKRQKLGLAGRKLVERLHDWAKITKKLEKAYQELVDEKKA